MKLENILAMARKWVEDLRKGDYGENAVYKVLSDKEYIIVPFPRFAELTQKKLTFEEKTEISRESIKFPDALALKVDESDNLIEAFFLDPKYKSRLAKNGVVNERDYDGYWIFIKNVEIDLKLFFYIRETNEIYVHVVRNPKQKPSLETTRYREADGNSCYKVYSNELSLYWKGTEHEET